MKTRLIAAALLLGTSALTACGAASSSGNHDEDGPIKVALIPPKSGALAQFGTDSVKAWQTAARVVNENGGIEGRKIELIVKSTDNDPATTLRAAREAVTADGAQFIGAVMTSPENAALNAQLEGLGALSFNALGQDDALVGEQCSPNAFHVLQTSDMHINTLAQALGDMPGQKWAIQAVDYATGHTAAKRFTAAAEKVGKEVVLEQYAPLNTTDFGTYISKIKDSGADAIFAAEYGADGVAFVQQADQFNLDEQLDTVLGLNMISEPLFETLGDTIVGNYNNVSYDVGLDNELNKAFVKAYQEDHGEAPYYISGDNYLAAETLFAGIKEADSSDPKKVADALDGLTFDSVVGEVTMRPEDHQLLRDDYLGRVVERKGGMAFEIVSTAGADVTTPKANPDCSM